MIFAICTLTKKGGKKPMNHWLYRIQGANGNIWTTNTQYAEQKSKGGYTVFCYRSNNKYAYHH